MVLAASGFNLGLVFVTSCILTGMQEDWFTSSSWQNLPRFTFVASCILINRNTRKLVAPPSVYEQLEVLPLHQKKENRSRDTANHTTQNTLCNTQENRAKNLKHPRKHGKESKGGKESETLKKTWQRRQRTHESENPRSHDKERKDYKEERTHKRVLSSLVFRPSQVKLR